MCERVVAEALERQPRNHNENVSQDLFISGKHYFVKTLWHHRHGLKLLFFAHFFLLPLSLSLSLCRLFVRTSATRLSDFLKFMVTYFSIKVAQIFGKMFGLFKKHHQL